MRTLFRHAGARLPLLAAGYLMDKPWWLGPRVLDAYSLVHLLAGAGTYRDPNGQVDVKAGDTLVLFPELEHEYGPRNPGDWSEAFVIFYGAAFAGLERDGLIHRQRPVLHAGVRPRFAASFKALIEQHSTAPSSDPHRTTLELHRLLFDLTSADGGTLADEEAERLAAARARLQRTLDRDIDLQALATEFGFGYESFRKRFARAFGVPPARYRLLCRLDRAKTLLSGSDAKLSDIAAAIGFCDEYYLSRKFKQVTGASPRVYRQRLRGGAA